MDTSETYIKMCDCEEIQKPERWLLFTPKCLDNMVWSGEDVFFDGKDKLIWLPRQDQLQEMLKKSVWLLVAEFWNFCNSGMTQDTVELAKERMHIHIYKSMEQLWLAFVMKEKYNKVWNGEKWLTT